MRRRRRAGLERLSLLASAKASCRAQTNVLRRRGHLLASPCAYCGDPYVQAHHPDYARPRLVIWLCKRCHRVLHRLVRDAEREGAIR